MNLKNESIYYPQKKGISNKSKEVEYIQNILFVKNQSENRFDPLIIRYYPDDQVSNRTFKNIHYQSIDEKWMGWIDLFSYDEHHLKGFKIERGQITKFRTITESSELGKKSNGNENKDVIYQCDLVSVDWYDGRTGEYLDTTHSTECDFEYVGGGASYGSGYVSGGYSSGGAGCIGCDSYSVPSVPEPNLRVQLDPSFKNNPYLMCILDKLQLSKFINELALFDGTIGNMRNVILKVGETVDSRANAETNDKLGPYHIEITLNQNKVGRNSLEMARTILHELIHAELFVAIYLKKGSPVDGNFEYNFSKYLEEYSYVTSAQHNYMAENLVSRIAIELQRIHPYLGLDEFRKSEVIKLAYPKSIVNPDFYKVLAWQGLLDTSVGEKFEKDYNAKNWFDKHDKNKNYLTRDCE